MPTNGLYQEYRCSRNAPLSCDQPQKTIQEYRGAKFCMECGFPTILAAAQEIKGRRGTYRVKTYLGARGYGRLYAGVRLSDNQPVILKEYLLPNRCFNQEESRQRQETFVRVAGLNPADGRVQDFRLTPTLEAIADSRDNRCYLITEEKELAPTLRDVITNQGAMTAGQVREVLNQALQTLQFLHGQKFRRPSGQMDKGIAHGNLSLDSLLMLGNASQFYIYLCDLADWELLFQPVTQEWITPQLEHDLVALGQTAFYLWRGQQTDPASGHPLDPRDERQWSNDDPPLRQFILRLMGLEAPFENAEAARQTLLQLPRADQANRLATLLGEEIPANRRIKRWLALVGILAVLLLGGGLWYWLWRSDKSSPSHGSSSTQLPYKTFAEVNGVDPGQFRYVGEQEGSWSFLLGLSPQGKPLRQVLFQPKPDIVTTFEYTGLSSAVDLLSDKNLMSRPIQEVQDGKADFALTSLDITSLKNQPTDQLQRDSIAYDGLLVFVPFSKKAQNLPKALDGKISLQDLRRIYTGEIQDWQALGASPMSIVPRIPTDPEAVRLFQKLVLQDDPQAIAQFRQTVKQTQPTPETERRIRNEFDTEQKGVISFGILSKTWDQCGGYPLALVSETGAIAQAITRPDGQPITPSDNLCTLRPSHLNQDLFRSGSYPLGYPLFVVYPNDNTKPGGSLFVAFLKKTQQGQCLLGKVGLVPLQPVTDCP